MPTISPERLAVLQAAAEQRLLFVPGPLVPSSLMRQQRGIRTVSVTPAANWLRSHGLIRISGPTAGDGRRRFALTPLGRQALETGALNVVSA